MAKHGGFADTLLYYSEILVMMTLCAMPTLLRALALVCVAVLAACQQPQQKDRAAMQEQLWRSEPVTPQQGKPLTVYYNTAHKNARYKNADSLWATITITTEHEYKVYRHRLRPSAAGSRIVTAAVELPKTAVFVDITVSSYLDFMSQENMSSGVYRGEYPAPGTLPAMIETAQSYDAAAELFRVDAELYPKDFRRYGALWQGQLRNGGELTAVLKQVDSIYAVLGGSLSPVEKSQGYAACAAAYAQANDWAKSTAAVQAAQAQRVSHQPLYTANYMGTILSCVCAYQEEQTTPNDSVETLLKHVLVFASEQYSHQLASYALNGADSVSVCGTLREYYAQIAARAYAHIDELFTAAAAPQLSVLSGIALTAYWQGNHALVQAVEEQGRSITARIPEWESTSQQPMAMRYLPGAIAPTLRSILATSYIRHNNITEAHEVLSSIVAMQVDMEKQNLGVISISLARKAQLFVREGLADSAEKYWVWAQQMQSPFADAIFAGIQRLRHANKQTPPNAEELVARYSSARFASAKAPLLVFRSDKGDMRTQGNGDTVLYLFFVGKNCGVCKKYVPGIIKQVAGSAAKSKILVISDDDTAYLRSVYGNIAIAPLEAAVKHMLRIYAQPTIMAVYKGNIIVRNDGLSESSAQRFVSQVLAFTVKH